MFDLRTGKGLAAAGSLVALTLLLVACPGTTPPAPQVTVPSATPASTSSDPAEAAADEVSADADDAADNIVAAAVQAAATFGSCHDHNDAGGASDGVLTLAVGSEWAGVTVEVDVTTQDGAGTATVSGLVLGDGTVTVLVPLSYFGEVVEVTAVRIDGIDADLSSMGSRSFTVEETSTCAGHPSEG